MRYPGAEVSGNVTGNEEVSETVFLLRAVHACLGILFGGYFGNIVDIVSEKFFGHTVTVPALWFVPLNDPMKLLVYSLLFGVIHLFVGLGIKGYLCLKDKKYNGFLLRCSAMVYAACGADPDASPK